MSTKAKLDQLQSGTLGSSFTATLTDNLSFVNSASGTVSVNLNGGFGDFRVYNGSLGEELQVGGGSVLFNGSDNAIVVSSYGEIDIYSGSSGFTIVDNRITAAGLEYLQDYSSTYSNRSLVDKEYADSRGIYGGSGTIASGAIASLDNAETFNINYASGNASVYVSDNIGTYIGSDDATTQIGVQNDSIELSTVNSTITIDDNTIISSGFISLTGIAGNPAELRLLEPSGSGSNYIGFKSQAMASNISFTLPDAYPATTGYVLSSTDAGILSWADPSTFGTPDGNGIYDGSGTIPASTIATITTGEDFRFNYSSGSRAMRINDSLSYTRIYGDDSNATHLSAEPGLIFADTTADFDIRVNHLSRFHVSDTSNYWDAQVNLSLNALGYIYLGSDTNIDLTSETVNVKPIGTSGGTFRIYEPLAGGSNYIELVSPTLAATTSYTLPDAYPATSGYVLSSTDAGVMSWVAGAASDGNGIYTDGANTIGAAVVATLQSGDSFTMAYNSGDEFLGVNDSSGTMFIQADGANTYLTLSPSSVTLSIAADTGTIGQVLTATGSGTATWEDATGDGIYSGSGTIAPAAVATLTSTSSFTIDYNGGNNGLHIEDALGTFTLKDKTGSQIVAMDDSQVGMSSGSNSVVVDSVSGTAINNVLRIYNAYLSLDGSLTPAQITASQNDYAPTGIDDAGILRLDSDGDYNITGITNTGAITGGRVLTIINIGANTITLTNDDAASTAAYRFLLNDNVVLGPEESTTLWYDSSTARWRAMQTTIPGYSATDNNGIYTGSGNIASATTATIASSSFFTIDYNNSNPALNITDSGAITLTSDGGSIQLNYPSTSGIIIDPTFNSVSLFSENGTQYITVSDDEVSQLIVAAPSTDHTASGTKITLTANENQNFGDVCYIDSSGEAALADASAIATAGAVVMCMETVTTGNPATYLMVGVARDDTWAWTVGGLIYLSTTGTTGNTLTQTAPSATGEVIQVVGVATHADRMIFNPNLMMIEHA